MDAADVSAPIPQGRPAVHRRTVITVFVAVVVATLLLAGSIVAAGLLFAPVKEHIIAVLAWTVSVHALLMLIVVGVLLRRAGADRERLGVVRPSRRLLHVLWQVPLAIGVLLAVNLTVAFALGSDTPPGAGGADFPGIGRWSSVVALVGMGLLTPLWEELVFRGMLYDHLREKSLAAAVLGSALLFAAVHGVPILLPYLFTLGLLLAWLRHFHGNLWGPLALHMALNTLISAAGLTALN